MHALTEREKHTFCDETIGLKETIELEYLSFGARLVRIHDERLWEAGWSSWDEYLMETKLSGGSASKIMNIWRVFHVRLGISEKKLALAGGWSVVAEYLPLVTADTTADEALDWVEDAAIKPRSHIRRDITEAKKGVSQTACKHEEAYTLFCCPTCGERHKI